MNSKYKKIIVDSSTITEIKYSTTNSQNSKGFFSNLNNIIEIDVNVPSLTTLSDSSFSSNGGLVKVDLSKTKITSIPNSAFKNCSGLTTLLLSTGSDDTTNNTITSIDNEAFLGTRKLSSLKFSSSITSIGDSAFKNSGIQTVDLSNNKNLTIGNSAFESAFNLTTFKYYGINNSTATNTKEAVSSTSEKGLTNLGNNAFKNCSKLENFYPTNINESTTNYQNKKHIYFSDSISQMGDLYFLRM